LIAPTVISSIASVEGGLLVIRKTALSRQSRRRRASLLHDALHALVTFRK
jgi:hypothetical protein